MRLIFYCTILVCIISCKKVAVSQPANKTVSFEEVDSLIIEKESCYIKFENNKIYLNYDKNDKTLNVEQLNFIMNQLSDVKIDCEEDKIIIKYYEKIGNQNIQTSHILNKKNDKLLLSKIYRFESNRNEINIFGEEQNNEINDYIGVEPNVKMIDIYNFSGFQQELIPTIDEYFHSVTLIFKEKNYEKLSLYTDPIVISYIIDIVEINKSNISMYNDIAFYLEQSGIYKEATFLLEKIIQQFPNRTVAYINLGDAYWGINDYEKAKKAYKEYIMQMKESGKEKKIPKIILERL